MMNKRIIIAIDGFSSCGKSTLAKAVAKKLGYSYLDSGAMYRCVTLYCVQNGVDVNDKQAVISILDQVDIVFKPFDGLNTAFLNGVNVEEKLRTLDISNRVSEVAAIPEVRRKLVQIQKNLGKEKGIVMDGRDITTVVFPDAELKIFLTADEEIRAMRRHRELVEKGQEVTLDEVTHNLTHRDHIDSTRKTSPLRQAEDAFVIDNTLLNRDEQVDVVLKYVEHICNQS